VISATTTECYIPSYLDSTATRPRGPIIRIHSIDIELTSSISRWHAFSEIHCYRHEHPARSHFFSSCPQTSALTKPPPIWTHHVMRLASPRSGATRPSRTGLPFGREITPTWTKLSLQMFKCIKTDFWLAMALFHSQLTIPHLQLGLWRLPVMASNKYGFKDDLHFGEDNLVTLRWTLDAVFAGSSTVWVRSSQYLQWDIGYH